MNDHPPQPVFLIGAARSGTKLLRDVIASHPAIDRVPYDINFIWRLGYESVAHDELSPEDLAPAAASRIRRKVEAFSRGAPRLIEKTVSNSLRLPFVEAIFPQAKYILLFRDGRDVVESAYRQWVTPPDWKYLLEKARHFPFLDAPSYAMKYAENLLRQRTPHARQASTWGPRYEDIDRDVAEKEPIEVCGLQWARCVERATMALKGLDRSRAMVLKYEDFVLRPLPHLLEIAGFLGVDPEPYHSPQVIGRISAANVGKGWRQLSPAQRRLAGEVIQAQLNLLGYPPASVHSRDERLAPALPLA